MATVYLRSTDGSDADDGSTWALAKATLAAALTAAGAGGTVYVSQAHAETQATAMTLDSPGTENAPVRVVCASDAAEPPTARAETATVTVSGNAAMAYRGAAYIYGVRFFCGGGNSSGLGFFRTNPGSVWWRCENCHFELTNSGAASVVFIGTNSATGASVEWLNCTMKFSNVAQFFRLRARFIWRGGSVDTGGSAPTALLHSLGSGDAGIALLEGVDLSALGSGNSLVSTASGYSGIATFTNCKLGSSVALVSAAVASRGGPAGRLINSDSSDTGYRFAQTLYAGAETQETTIVRTGGASDGTTTVSRKVVTVAGASIHGPYESMPIEHWNDTVGSPLTLTVPVLADNVTLSDAEAWLEVDYLGTSGFPLGLTASGRVADPIFGTPANQPTDATSSWTTTGMTTPVKQSLSVTVTPQEKGIIRARVCVARASTTVYYDPKIVSTSGRQYQSVTSFINEGASGGGYSRGRVVNS